MGVWKETTLFPSGIQHVLIHSIKLVGAEAAEEKVSLSTLISFVIFITAHPFFISFLKDISFRFRRMFHSFLDIAQVFHVRPDFRQSTVPSGAC